MVTFAGGLLSLTPSNFLDIDALLEGSRYLSATFRLTTSWTKRHLSDSVGEVGRGGIIGNDL